MSKQKYPGFDACMAMMRKHDPQIQEDGFFTLLPYASEYVDKLVDEFHKEKDHGLKCWLLELIGEAKSQEAFLLLVEYLKSDDEMFRRWAARGLQKLNTKEARRILLEARTYTFNDAEETADFQKMLDEIKRYK